MTRFPSAAHLASWAGLCPGNHQSAGKRQSGPTRKANPWLRAALTEAAQGAGRTKQTHLEAQYRRLAARRGAKRASVAVGHSCARGRPRPSRRKTARPAGVGYAAPRAGAGTAGD